MLATLAAVVVLIVSSFNQLPMVVIALATFTLLLAVARTFVGFLQVQRLSDARRQAVTDELTGLGSRRSLFEHGDQRLQDAGRSDRLALILIDLDNFKEINDTLGHRPATNCCGRPHNDSLPGPGNTISSPDSAETSSHYSSRSPPATTNVRSPNGSSTASQTRSSSRRCRSVSVRAPESP